MDGIEVDDPEVAGGEDGISVRSLSVVDIV